jgi:hypothetical protein
VCIFLRAVAVRADQLRQELVPEIDDQSNREHFEDGPVEAGSSEPVTASVLSPPKPKAKPSTNGQKNGKNNGHASAHGPRR